MTGILDNGSVQYLDLQSSAPLPPLGKSAKCYHCCLTKWPVATGDVLVSKCGNVYNRKRFIDFYAEYPILPTALRCDKCTGENGRPLPHGIMPHFVCDGISYPQLNYKLLTEHNVLVRLDGIVQEEGSVVFSTPLVIDSNSKARSVMRKLNRNEKKNSK
jgi:hypothetical protein